MSTGENNDFYKLATCYGCSDRTADSMCVTPLYVTIPSLKHSPLVANFVLLFLCVYVQSIRYIWQPSILVFLPCTDHKLHATPCLGLLFDFCLFPSKFRCFNLSQSSPSITILYVIPPLVHLGIYHDYALH